MAVVLSNVAYSQYSNDSHNPLVINPANNCARSNVRIATTNDGHTFIVSDHMGAVENETIFELSILDVKGNVKFNSYLFTFSESYTENNFNLIAFDDKALLSVGGKVFCIVKNNGNHSYFKLLFDEEEQPVGAASVDINDAGEIVYAIPTLEKLLVNKLSSDGDFALPFDVEIFGFNTMPKVRFNPDGSFYVVYKIYDKLYADLYDKNCNMTWKGIYVAHETGDDLSSNDEHQVIPDGQGGMYVIWKKGNIFVQRITSNEDGNMGVRKFTDYGMALTEGTTECYNPIASLDKNTNELNVIWRSQNQNTNSVNLQKITIDGEKKWGTNGIVVDESFLAYHNTPVAIGTTPDKIMLVFSKYNVTSQNYDLVYNRYSKNGEKQFQNNIDVNISKYERSSIVSTDFYDHQIVVAWSDSTEDNQIRTLAQNITYNGVIGNDSSSIEETTSNYEMCVYPVPTNDDINIKINSKHNTNASVQIFDYLGKLLFEANNLELNIGENVFMINKKLPIGEYNMLINTTDEQVYQSIIVK